MKGRRGTALIIAAALIVGGILIARSTYWDDVTVFTPPAREVLENPYYSVEHLMHAVGISVRRLATLRTLPSGGVLYVPDLRADLAQTSLPSLEAWVAGGGELLIPGSLLRSSVPLQRWSGIAPAHREPPGAAPPGVAPPPTARHIGKPGGAVDEGICTPLKVRVAGVESAETICIDQPLREPGYTSERVPEWALLDARGKTIVLRERIGRGELTVFGPAYLLNNQALARHDNARLLIAASALERGDTLLILAPTRAEPLWLLLWHGAAAAIVFAALTVLALILRHWPRFGPAAPVPVAVRRSLAEQIEASARFAWRTHRLGALRAAIRRALGANAARHLAGFAAHTPAEQARMLARLTGLDAAALRAALTEDASGTRERQLEALTLLERARRVLMTAPPHTSSTGSTA